MGVCVLLAPASSWAGPTPPAPTQWVTDPAGFLSKPVAQSLNARLGEYQQRSGQQLLIWIGKSTDGDPIADWAVRTFKAWRIGRKGFDDGLILFVMADDRTARIEVGYGLEGQVPDAVASRIINETLIPRIKAGDRDGAVLVSVGEVVSALGGKLVAEGTAQTPISLSPLQIVLAVLFTIVLVILGFRYPVFGYYLLMILSSMTRRGGGGSNAGGGGGRSGGGGAGGKW